jgi:ATP-binding cassette subfamily F protein 3
MFQIKDIRYSIGTRLLLDGVSAVINPGSRVALIGPNGSGKTTLLRLITGELSPEDGSFITPKDYRIGYLPQEEMALEHGSLLSTVLQGRPEVMSVQQSITGIRETLSGSSREDREKLETLGGLEHQFEMLGGYQLETEAKAILSGLGFRDPEMTRPLHELSGGWRMRVYLARILVQKPHLLLLDEPTNHLDLPALEWLEDYLQEFSGSMLLVSHDRFFIERLAQEILELERGQLTHYTGQFHEYETQKQQNREQKLKEARHIQEERERLQRFIDRFRYKATKASQVQSRIKRLEKLKDVEIPPVETGLAFEIHVETPSYQHVLHIGDLSFQYDNDPVFQHIDLDLYRGEKVALVGVNGAGKTTLTRLITYELQPDRGEIRLGERTRIGYYAQHQIDALESTATVMEEVSSHAAPVHQPRVRDILGVFQFQGDDVYKPIQALSGGEKARVSLAKILLSPVNFLIMDEPTNHLDTRSRKALEHALIHFDGTLLLISHDRYFLDQMVSRVIEIKDHRLRTYEGNYSDYLRKREPDQVNVSKSSDTPGGRKSREQKRAEANARHAISSKRKHLEAEIQRLEQSIESLEHEKTVLEQMMAQPETYQDGAKAANLQKQYHQVSNQLETDLKAWETAQLDLDTLMQSLDTVRNSIR